MCRHSSKHLLLLVGRDLVEKGLVMALDIVSFISEHLCFVLKFEFFCRKQIQLFLQLSDAVLQNCAVVRIKVGSVRLWVACRHSHHSHAHTHLHLLLLKAGIVGLLTIRCNLLEFVPDGRLKHLGTAHLLLTLIYGRQVLLLLLQIVKLILLVHAHGHLRHHLILLLLLHLDLVDG